METRNGRAALLFFLGIMLDKLDHPEISDDEIYQRWQQFNQERAAAEFDRKNGTHFGYWNI